MNPEQLKYTETHEWIAVEGDTATIGISDFAVHLLSDLVFADLPAAGKKLTKGQPFGEQAFLKGGIRGASAKAKGQVVCMCISTDEANAILTDASPILIPIFEALLLQQNMHNALKISLK